MRRERVEPGIWRRSTDGKLEIVWKDAGSRQRRRTIEGGIKAARAALAAEHVKRAKGEMVPEAPRLTFNAAADLWWEAHVARFRAETQLQYSTQLRPVREEFGAMRLSAITPALLARYVTRCQVADGLKGGTIHARLKVISGTYRYAIRHLGHPGANPVAQLEQSEKPVNDAEPPRVLTDEELAALLAAFEPRHRLLFELLAETGLRQGEVRGLIWSNIDLGRAELTVEATLPRVTDERQPPKTQNSLRTIALSLTMVAKLREHRLAMGRPFGGEFVFLRPPHVNAQYRAYDAVWVNRLMRDARERAGIGPIMRGREVIAGAPTPHDLRHTHASRLIAAGWDVVEVAARLGDRIDTVLSVYAHEFDARRRRADQSERLEALFHGSAMAATDSAEGPFSTGAVE
jgi:integrase